MTNEELEQRLAERRLCEAKHEALRVPHNGFGWTGYRCSVVPQFEIWPVYLALSRHRHDILT